MVGSQDLCKRCALTRYEHVDHLHNGPGCPFGDCGAFISEDKIVADDEKLDRLAAQVAEMHTDQVTMAENVTTLAKALLQVQLALLGDRGVGHELLEEAGIPVPAFIGNELNKDEDPEPPTPIRGG
jgi:hypothetical protein